MSDREKLIELLEKGYSFSEEECNKYIGECVSKCCPYYDKSHLCGYIAIAEYMLSNGVTVQRWIPVSERLPERNGTYMVHASVRGHKYIDCVSFAQDLYRIDPYDFHGRKGKSGFYTYDNEYGFGEYQGVTHWMPLPEPPKGE